MSRRFNRDDIGNLHDYGIYLPTRTVYVGSLGDDDGDENGTDYAMARSVIKNLHILDSVGDSPITVMMNNPGGDVTHGMAVFDAIRACRSKVKIRVIGSAESMGSVILQAGDERIITPNSTVMIHYGTLSSSNHSKIVEAHVKDDKRFCTYMEDLFLDKIRVKHPKYTRARLQKLLNFDTILTAQEAVDLGLADRIEETT